MKPVLGACGALPSKQIVKRQHLRAFQAKNGWKGAPVLEFPCPAVDFQSCAVTANSSIGPGA